MSDQYVGVALDGPGKKIDVEEVVVGANTIQRQRIVVAGKAATELADVRNAAPGASDMGLVVRVVGPVSPLGVLVAVAFDYLSLAVGATTDTWTYKSGGAGGTLVATVVITYTDSGKETISSVART